MFGGILGFVICFITSLCGATSWWWLLWGSLIGAVVEVLSRLTSGEAIADIASGFGDILGSAGDFMSSGDSGGSSDCGGGGGDFSGGGDW